MHGKEKSEVLRFQIRSKDVLAPDEMELFELTQLAGVAMDPSVFKILLDLLKVNVAPMALMQMLKLQCDPQLQRSAGAAAHIQSFLSTSSDSLSLSHSTANRSSSGSSSTRHQRSTASGKSRQALSSTRQRDGRH